MHLRNIPRYQRRKSQVPRSHHGSQRLPTFGEPDSFVPEEEQPVMLAESAAVRSSAPNNTCFFIFCNPLIVNCWQNFICANYSTPLCTFCEFAIPFLSTAAISLITRSHADHFCSICAQISSAAGTSRKKWIRSETSSPNAVV